MTDRAYDELFSPVRYSSGESIIASSDAQNVDFGTGSDNTRHVPQSIGNAVGNSAQIYNATPNDNTSDFGVVNYPFGRKGKIKREKAIPVAIKQPAKGARFTAGFTRGAPSGGGMVGTALTPLDKVARTSGTLDGQKESQISRYYRGQLG